MKFLKSLRSKSPFRSKESNHFYQDVPPASLFSPPAKDYFSSLPSKVLERIFRFVCPHATDESYDSCEASTQDDVCMLCDLRDLSNCVKVSRRWRKPATTVLYHSLRLDAVHYCDREAQLSDKRKRPSFFDRNHDSEDPTTVRLRLLCRTLQEDPRRLGALVKYFKLPYMTRETCKADIARSISATPNLLYIDLPEGVYVDDASCMAVRAEVQARCKNLRKMAYRHGSERSLASLADGYTWRNLEVLELSELQIDMATLRRVFGALPYIHKLKVSNMKLFTSDIFQENPMLPPFPALRELHLEETPNVTAEALATYIAQTDTSNRLETMSLVFTGILPSSAHLILAEAKNLRDFSIIEHVTQPMPADPDMRSLSSASLRILHWEITSESPSNIMDLMIAPYYDYLRTSLLSQSLPKLKELYVREPTFPETLLDLAPPRPMFAADSGSTNPFSPSHRPTQSLGSRNPFNKMPTAPQSQRPQGINQELVVFCKGLDEMEWNYSKIEPPSQPGKRGSISAARPISSYGLLGEAMTPTWNRSDARRSVIVGNGFGGFLAVPESEMRPSSSYGEKGKKHEKKVNMMDMWR